MQGAGKLPVISTSKQLLIFRRGGVIKTNIMENKNINTGLSKANLLQDSDFKSLIKFESEYAGIIKGGHLPAYYPKEAQKRLINPVNLLTSLEQVQLVQTIFISKN